MTRLDNLSQQPAALQVIFLALGLSGYSASGSTSAASDDAAQGGSGTVAALFFVLLGYSAFLQALVIFRVKRADARLHADGIDLALPEGWLWFDQGGKDYYVHAETRRYGTQRPTKHLETDTRGYPFIGHVPDAEGLCSRFA